MRRLLLALVTTAPTALAGQRPIPITIATSLGRIEAELDSAHAAGLGGFRRSHPGSLNTGWRNLSFRGFADYMQTPEFATELAELIERATRERIALMCAEAVPWRCHRSLLADALLVHGVAADEIVSLTRTEAHKLTPFAKVHGTVITYPPEAPVLPGLGG